MLVRSIRKAFVFLAQSGCVTVCSLSSIEQTEQKIVTHEGRVSTGHLSYS